MTKKVEGIMFVVLGMVFYLAKPITYINYPEFMSAIADAGENINGRYETFNRVIVIYGTSLIYYLIPLIFIVLGVIKLKEAYSEKT